MSNSDQGTNSKNEQQTDFVYGSKSSHTAGQNDIIKKSELKALPFQVSGHRNANTGMFDNGHGTVLKGLQPPPRGIRELNFYKDVFHPECQDPCLLEFQQLVPTFHGAQEIGEKSFLQLSNLMAKFKKPCLTDIKMGRITYDQEATPEKKLSEESKFPPSKDLGFQFSGIMLQVNNKSFHFKKSFCRGLTKDNIFSKGFGYFFSPLQDNQKRKAVQQLIARLRKMESWFLKQKRFSFIASSILVIYEGLNSSLTARELEKYQDQCLIETSSISSDKLSPDPNCNFSPTEMPGSSTCCLEVSNELNRNHQEICVSESHSENVSNVKRPHDSEDSNEEKPKRRKSDVDNTSSHMQKLQGEINSDTETCEEIPLITAHLIDFAHTFPAHDVDHNVLFGIQKLISGLQEFSNQ